MKRVLIATLVMAAVLAFCRVPAIATEKASKEECVALCHKAAEMVKTKGLAATLKAVADPHGPFILKDTYVFAMSTVTGSVLAHPYKPGLVGKNLLGLKDVNGVMFFAEILKIGKSKKGEGWVNYMWPKPGEKKPSPKTTYVYKVPGQDVSFCAGIYQ